MKSLIVILAVIIVILGLLPLVSSEIPESLSFIPIEGMSYNLLIALCGGLIVYLSLKKKENDIFKDIK